MMKVMIPYGSRLLVLSEEQFQTALALGAAYIPNNQEPGNDEQEVIHDAEGMEGATKIPASWFLEQARQGKLPHLRAGKYVRFQLGEVLEALKATRHADRISGSSKIPFNK